MRNRVELKIVYETMDVDRALSDLGLTRTILAEVASDALNARLNATSYDPVTAPGWFAWAAAARSLSEKMVGEDWERIDPLNVPYIQNEKRAVRIGVCNVDSACNPFRQPKRSRDPGSATQGAMELNATGMLDLRGGTTYVEVTDRSTTESYQTRFFMIGVDGTAELTLILKKEGEEETFQERIFIVTGADIDGPEPDGDTGSDSGEDDYEVPVQRRA